VIPGSARPSMHEEVRETPVYAFGGPAVLRFGLIACVGAAILLGLAIASRQRVWIVTSVLGLMGILGAGFNGASFLNYGHDFSSLIMSTGFLLAVISYTVGFSITR